MPQVEITIGGRTFDVACQEGEERFLHSAAAMLDVEAETLSSQIGRVPEARMLLMAGLMLADKTAALEDRLREAEERVQRAEAAGAAPPERVEVPVLPREVGETLAEIAARAEALADDIEARAGGAA